MRRHRRRGTAFCLFLVVFLCSWATTSPCRGELKADAGDDIVATAGDTVKFDGSRSRGNIARYRWNFGDHKYFDKAATFFESDLKMLKPGEGPRPSHTYWKAGRYDVTLNVFDRHGNTNADTVVVTVKPNRPPIGRIATSVENEREGEVLFDASGSTDPDDDPISYSWNFSDDTGSNEKVVRHRYDLRRIISDIGDCKVEYRVLLRTTDSHHATHVAGKWVSLKTAPEAAAEKVTTRPPFSRDLHILLTIRDGEIYVEKSPEAIEIFTGERIFIPFRVANRDRRSHTLTLTKISPKNTFARLEERPIPPEEVVTLSMEVKTLNVYDHALDLKLASDESTHSFSIPVVVRIRPFTPLLGGYSHFARNAAPDVTGRPFEQSGKFVHVYLGEKEAAEDMQLMSDYPIQVYRASCQWHNVQRKGPDSYEWELSDWEIDHAVKAGARVVVTFCTGPPEWAHRYDFTNDPDTLAAYRLFVEKMVDRYKNRVDYYELSNEPFTFWLGKFLGPKRMKALKSKRAEAEKVMDNFTTVITEAARVAFEVIQEKDPTAMLIMPGFENKTRKASRPFYFSVWERLFNKGIQWYCQRVGVHDFPLWYNAEPPSLSDLSGWKKLDENADSSELLAIMKRYDLPPGIWLTETGGFRNSDATEVNQAMAVLHTTAIIAHQHGEGILTVGLYDYPTDDSPYVYLMKYENHHKTLGFYAFKHLISALSGAVPYEAERIRNSNIIGSNYDSVVTKLFNRDREDILCLWNNSPTSEKVTLKLANGFDKSKLYEIEETSFSASGQFYSIRRYSEFASSNDTFSFPLEPLDFKIIQVITPSPRFHWLATLSHRGDAERNDE